jgi:hypothetical protein
MLLLLPHLVIPHPKKASSLWKNCVVSQSSVNLRLAQKGVIAHFELQDAMARMYFDIIYPSYN